MAMAISVRFPDGSEREVPSELRCDDSMASGAQARFRHVPINCDSHWRYIIVGSTWQAKPRRGKLSILTQPLDDWWQGIGAMAESPASSDAEIRSPRAA
jgi:hypothetical protein